jgi:hypothetical protein
MLQGFPLLAPCYLPAGAFACEHYRSKKGFEAWLSKKVVLWGIVFRDIQWCQRQDYGYAAAHPEKSALDLASGCASPEIRAPLK